MRRTTAFSFIMFISCFGFILCKKLPSPPEFNNLTIELVSPKDVTLGSLTPTFRWRSARSATGYELQFDSKPILTNSNLTSIAVNDTFYTLKSFLQETTYYWRARAVNSNESRVGDWTEQRSFTISVTGPTAAFSVDKLETNGQVVGIDSIAVTFTDQSTKGIYPIELWNWDLDGNGSLETSGKGPHTRKYRVGLFSIKLEVSDSVKKKGIANKTDYIKVRESQGPVASFQVNRVGKSLTFNFVEGSTPKDRGLKSWRWYFGDGDSAIVKNAPPHTYRDKGNYKIVLAVTDSANKRDFTSRDIEIKGPIANFSYSRVKLGTDSTLIFNFTNRSILGDEDIKTLSWNFGDSFSGANNTSEQPNPQHTFSQLAGTYTVKLKVTDRNNLTSEVTIPVRIKGPTAKFRYTRNNKSLTFNFTDASERGDSRITQWTWNFGDGTSSSSQDHSKTYLTAGSYKVTLTVKDNNNLTDITETPPQSPIMIFGPTAKFNTTANGLTVKFNSDPSIPGDESISKWEWDFGDGSTVSGSTDADKNPEHTYGQGGSYKVVLKVIDVNQLSDTTEAKNFQVTPKPPIAKFSYVTNRLTAQFDNQSTPGDGEITKWEWELGDGDTSQAKNPLHLYDASGSYKVVLKATDANQASDTTVAQNVIVSPNGPLAKFTVSKDGLTVTFEDQSEGNIATQEWNFGDGATLTNPTTPITHSYSQAGTYKVTLKITGTFGLIGTVFQYVTVP